MKVKSGLSPILGNISYSPFKETYSGGFIVAQVIDVILNNNEHGIGTIYWKKYNPTDQEENLDLSSLNKAIPLNPNIKTYPVKGELVIIFNISSARVDLNKYYYLSHVNIWNNPNNNEGAFFQNINNRTNLDNINILQPYNGDVIFEGRFGNTIRLGSTDRDELIPNLWSKNGAESSPIIIISNNISSTTGSNIENINKDNSSIYITSNQLIPLSVDVSMNPIVKSIEPSKYSTNSQIIFNSDRIVVSSKKDEVLIFGKTNIGLYTRKIINMDAEESVIINSPRIFLGLNKNNQLPSEPALLGDKATDLFSDILEALVNFSLELSEAISTPQGSPLIQVNQASIQLNEKLKSFIPKIQKIKSSKTFIS